MMTLRQNKQKMNYALQIGKSPIYEFYEDEQGVRYLLDTGETEIVYSEPEEFLANISMSGNEAEAREYGLSVADYEAVLVFDKNAVPLTEGALVWHESEVIYKYDGEAVEVETEAGVITEKVPDPISADYKVIKIANSLNVTKAILKAVNK